MVVFSSQSRVRVVSTLSLEIVKFTVPAAARRLSCESSELWRLPRANGAYSLSSRPLTRLPSRSAVAACPALSNQKVGIMEVDSEHMRMRLMPSPVQCLNAIKVRVDSGSARGQRRKRKIDKHEKPTRHLYESCLKKARSCLVVNRALLYVGTPTGADGGRKRGPARRAGRDNPAHLGGQRQRGGLRGQEEGGLCRASGQSATRSGKLRSAYFLIYFYLFPFSLRSGDGVGKSVDAHRTRLRKVAAAASRSLWACVPASLFFP